MDINHNLYIADDKEEYLSQVASEVYRIKTNAPESEVEIILPNYFSIEILKKKILWEFSEKQNNNCAILPKIISMDNYLSSIMYHSIIIPSHYEQIIIMSRIAYSFSGMNYKISESIIISGELVDLFWALKLNQISYNEIDKWVDEDLAQHWWDTSSFLQYCFEEFEKFIDKPYNKPRVKNQRNQTVILAGILDNLDLFINHFQSNNIGYHIILPPLGNMLFLAGNNDIAYLEKYYGKLVEGSRAKVAALTSSFETYLHEFYDIYEEVQYLLSLVASVEGSIAVVTNNTNLQELLAHKLDNLGIKYTSTFGYKYTKFDETILFQNLARFKAEDGSISSFVSLLATNLIFQNSYIKEFLGQINSSKKFHENFNSIIADKDLALSDSCRNFFAILENYLLDKRESFSELFEQNYTIFKKIYGLLECKSIPKNAEKFKNFIESISLIERLNFEISNQEYLATLLNVFSLKYTSPITKNAQVYIVKYEDAYSIDANLVIFTDFNQESLIDRKLESAWLSNKVLKKLGLFDNQDNYSKILYTIKTKLVKQDILITRSTNDNGVQKEKCAILDALEIEGGEASSSRAFLTRDPLLVPEILKKVQDDMDLVQDDKSESAVTNVIDISSASIKKKLYATNIELLMRNPFGFYAKNVLNLRKKKNILTEVQNNDFGSVVHEVIEIISKNENLHHIEVINKTLEKRGIPSYFQMLWKENLLEIALCAEEMNRVLASQKGKLFIEIEGSTQLNIGDKQIEICAIADRIEQFEDKIRIIDFKTGAPPSKVDVFSGKSPQLVIEAIILLENGFAGVCENVKLTDDIEVELVFYKVNTKKPYLEERVIAITREEISEHKEALIGFLEYYYAPSNAKFNKEEMPEFWKSSFDDYVHLRR